MTQILADAGHTAVARLCQIEVEEIVKEDRNAYYRRRYAEQQEAESQR